MPRSRLVERKAFLAGEAPPRLSESDTKANFIEPIIAALGWQGIGIVRREYYVKNSQEFIDYVMAGPDGLLLAIEAKSLHTQLTDKHAAQLIQYCAVEGIEWAALTNGRELQFFNTFLKPDLAAKRVLQVDLLAFNSDAEFDALFGQLWQMSRESMTTPSGVRTWLNQRRLDATLRAIITDPGSPVVRQLRTALTNAEIRATSQDVVQWFRSHLQPHVGAIPQPNRAPDNADIVKPGKPLDAESAGDAGGQELVAAQQHAVLQQRTKTYHGVTLLDLLGGGYLKPDSELILIGPGGRESTRARLLASGEIEWQGQRYRSLSDKTFAKLLGRQSLNGWT